MLNQFLCTQCLKAVLLSTLKASVSFGVTVIELSDENALFSQSHYHVTVTNGLFEIRIHMCWEIPNNSEPLTQSSCRVLWCHNRVRKYYIPLVTHLAVRTSRRYDLISSSSRPLWWNAVIQDICEAKGSWTLQTLVAYTPLVSQFGRLAVWKGVIEMTFKS